MSWGPRLYPPSFLRPLVCQHTFTSHFCMSLLAFHACFDPILVCWPACAYPCHAASRVEVVFMRFRHTAARGPNTAVAKFVSLPPVLWSTNRYFDFRFTCFQLAQVIPCMYLADPRAFLQKPTVLCFSCEVKKQFGRQPSCWQWAFVRASL